MLALIVFLLAVYGLANAIAVLKAGVPIKAALAGIPILGSLVRCPPCISFWAGMACSLWVLSPAAKVVDTAWKAALLDGLVACAFSYFAHVVMERTGLGVEDL